MRNSKAFKILAFIALFLLIIFSWILWKDAQEKKIRETPRNSGIEDPFGAGAVDTELPSSGSANQGTGTTGGQDIPVSNPVPDQSVTVVEDSPALRQISDKPVAGATFVVEERIIPEEESATPATGLIEVYDFSGYKTIRFGDKADEIIAIKTVLNRQTPSPGLTINNDYDTDMKNATVDFQNRSGLPGDGVIGPKTYQKLNLLQGITAFTSTKKPANKEFVLMARFVDSVSGTVHDRAVRKMEEEKAVTKTSVPRVVEAFFDSTGTNIIMRYLKDNIIETYLAKLTFPKIDPNLTQEEKDKVSKAAQVSGEFLPENIETVSISRDKKSFFYLNPVAGGVAGITYNFATKAKKQIFESPLSEWLADWGSDGKISLTTKASGLVPGYSYTIDSKVGTMARLIGGEKGLMTLLSPDGKKLLYSTFVNSSIETFIYDLAAGKSTGISPAALPEKCVWSKDSKNVYCLAPIKAMSGNMPDDWYKGKVTFDDALWVTDLINYNGNIIYDFKAKSGQGIDAVNPVMNATEDYILFKNRKDGTLWGYDLNK